MTTTTETSEETETPQGTERDQTEKEVRPSLTSSLIEWVVVIAGSVALALVVRAFLLQSFFIPSASMEPTLTVDDRVMVNKLSYQWSDPSPGDVVVFTRPEGLAVEDEHLIKRVVAVAGQTVEGRDGVVFVDGEALDEDYLDPEAFTSSFTPVLIDDAMVWVMGDNRSHSSDSRFFGPIPVDTIVGRSFVQIWPLSSVEAL